MAANPQLVAAADGSLAPAPFPGETLALARHGVEVSVDGLQAPNGRWSSAGGTLWLTDVRLVFVAAQIGPEGLRAFDIPLAYIAHDKFNQPIFGCNNLAGRVWPAVENGGPAGTLPPHEWRLYFKEGGVGTLLPLYYRFVGAARVAAQVLARQQQQAEPPVAVAVSPSAPPAPQSLVATALVDPSDPSKVFLTQPVGEEARLAQAPRYSSIYGKEGDTEAYQPMA